MQGKGTEGHGKVGFLLILFTFLSMVMVGVSCTQWEKEDREYAKKYDAQFKYKLGDVVYLKPDSTIGVITDRTLWTENRIEYRIRYSTNVGKLEYVDVLEPIIFSKK